MVNAILGSSYDLTQTLNQIQRQLRDLSTQPILRNASTGQSGGQGLSTDLNGLHLFNPAGAETATLSTLDGSATFGGNVIINGNLSVPNGSISNAALQNPISPSLQSTSVTNFAVPNTATDYAGGTITVPAGFTSAIVDCSGYFGAVNSIGGVQYIYVSVVINGVAGHQGIGGNNSASLIWVAATSRKISFLTGLTPGGTISIGLNVSTSDTVTWGANTSNRAYCDASAIFLR